MATFTLTWLPNWVESKAFPVNQKEVLLLTRVVLHSPLSRDQREERLRSFCLHLKEDEAFPVQTKHV